MNIEHSTSNPPMAEIKEILNEERVERQIEKRVGYRLIPQKNPRLVARDRSNGAMYRTLLNWKVKVIRMVRVLFVIFLLVNSVSYGQESTAKYLNPNLPIE